MRPPSCRGSQQRAGRILMKNFHEPVTSQDRTQSTQRLLEVCRSDGIKAACALENFYSAAGPTKQGDLRASAQRSLPWRELPMALRPSAVKLRSAPRNLRRGACVGRKVGQRLTVLAASNLGETRVKKGRISTGADRGKNLALRPLRPHKRISEGYARLRSAKNSAVTAHSEYGGGPISNNRPWLRKIILPGLKKKSFRFPGIKTMQLCQQPRALSIWSVSRAPLGPGQHKERYLSGAARYKVSGAPWRPRPKPRAPRGRSPPGPGESPPPPPTGECPWADFRPAESPAGSAAPGPRR